MPSAGSRPDDDGEVGSAHEWLRRGEALGAQGDLGGALECMLIKASLLATDEAARRIVESFAAAGIGAAHLELRSWETERTRHLEAYNEIDVALDTFPYNGATTTCEALWMGVPVVTLSGDTHMSRVGAMLLAAAGLEELVASKADAYVQIAVGLARDAARRVSLRQNMRERLEASSLLDHAGFTSRLEAAYRQTSRAWCDTTHPEGPASRAA